MPGTSTAGPLGVTPQPAIDAGTNPKIPTPNPSPVGATSTPAAAPVAAASAAPETDPDIDALDLRNDAKKAAYALKKAHPAVKFTSGRRDKSDQARAMASNVVENRKWIEQTYVDTKVSRACQKWVDDNKDKKTRDEIAEGLLSTLNDFTDEDLSKLSKHLSGDAFDVQPVETNADDIKKTIRGLDGLDKFLEKEGGLVRWHAQF